ncbi:hypothetical protein Tco_0142585, partial [Tanacetum coccineum]
MDDPNMTMEEYIKPVEIEFPTIEIDDTVTPQDALPCKSQVSTPVNDEIDFRISFDDSDDEDYIIICDINSFSYKMISVNNLKTDSKNDNEKAASLSECDEEEQNILYFNDLFSFNVIYPDNSKSDKDNDDDKIDIEHSSGDMSIIPLSNVINADVGAYAHGSNKLSETSH